MDTMVEMTVAGYTIRFLFDNEQDAFEFTRTAYDKHNEADDNTAVVFAVRRVS